MEPGNTHVPLTVALVPFVTPGVVVHPAAHASSDTAHAAPPDAAVCVPDAAVGALTVTVERPLPTALALRYRLEGQLARLRIPPPLPPQQAGRQDGLWRHTCFEAFVGPATGSSYHEYNLAPSRAWAAYAFEAYRSGMQSLAVPSPTIEVGRESGLLLLAARLAVPPGPLRLALATVVELGDGTLSYWALRHGRDRPDFHHADGFALRL
jgi:hypothetical protein